MAPLGFCPWIYGSAAPGIGRWPGESGPGYSHWRASGRSHTSARVNAYSTHGRWHASGRPCAPPARANACCKREQWHASGWLCQPPAPAPQACVRGYSSASARVSAPHGHRTSMHARLGGHRVHQFPGFAARLPHLTAIRFASAEHLHDQRLVRPCEGTVTCSLAATSMGQRQKMPPTPAARVPFCSSLPLSAFNTGRRPRGAQARLLACVLSYPCEPAPGLRAAAIGLPRSVGSSGGPAHGAPCNGLLGAAPHRILLATRTRRSGRGACLSPPSTARPLAGGRAAAAAQPPPIRCVQGQRQRT